jgi:hypothetical protein
MPRRIPDLNLFVDTFKECAHRHGFKGLYLLATHCPTDWNPHKVGFDGVISNNFHNIRKDASKRIVNNKHSLIGKIEGKIRSWVTAKDISERTKPFVIEYEEFANLISRWPDVDFDYFPLVIPDWDNSPRAGVRSLIVKNSTPERWLKHLEAANSYIKKYDAERQIIFIKSWNEWAEGNYLEADQKWGLQYLKMIPKLQ